MVKDLSQKRIWIDIDLEEEGADALAPAFDVFAQPDSWRAQILHNYYDCYYSGQNCR